MQHAHAAHCSVRLNSGTILIAGGADETGQSTALVDVYDPNLNLFSDTLTMSKGRLHFTATLLTDGNVLVAGGTDSISGLYGFADAELYQPAGSEGGGGFTPVPNMGTGRQDQAAVLLNPGNQVLLIGGWSAGWPDDPIKNAEIFTESAISQQPFSYTSGDSRNALRPGRRGAAAVVLPNGQALLVGGDNAANGGTLYNPLSQAFTDAANFMSQQRDTPTAILLKSTSTSYDGQVLVVGGVIPGTPNYDGSLLEIYHPDSQTWTSGGHMIVNGVDKLIRRGLTSTLFGKATDSLPVGAN